jgi:hypothetical protein
MATAVVVIIIIRPDAFDVPMIRPVVTNIEPRAVIESVVFHFLVVVDICIFMFPRICKNEQINPLLNQVSVFFI